MLCVGSRRRRGVGAGTGRVRRFIHDSREVNGFRCKGYLLARCKVIMRMEREMKSLIKDRKGIWFGHIVV